ncbi:unnamed protein product [Caenorhabditis auriculariae]|uniref:Uncharacterized protein n=1 Tax=Caenorhabditis auriculariae TaxID=2777116 RepID=A0A8S1I0B4_9PELO|nr:unnamed protein product [Caenorhabditis auriculariae]
MGKASKNRLIIPMPLAASRRSHAARFILTLVAFVTIFGIATNFNSTTTSPCRPEERVIGVGQSDEEDVENEPLLPHHPFDNHCKFPLPNHYQKDIYYPAVSERMRQLKCPIETYDLATMDSEGYIYVHPHFAHFPNYTRNVQCKVFIIEGGIRNKSTNSGKDTINIVATINAPENERLWVNADAFYIRCFNTSKGAKNDTIWEKPFAGMRDLGKPRNTVTKVSDHPSFDKYARRLIGQKSTPSQRISIDILGFDSTSRTMFFRHLPRTVETMNKLGYHFFYGYNKVGDNSMVNLAPVLIGDVPEALKEPMLNNADDINENWILPTNKKLDPTNLNFLWKMMSEKFGCRSMLNEDISMKHLGLFNYPAKEFQPGFTEPPADHYYRAYYLAVYEKWLYSVCKDGTQLQKEFVGLWRKFAHRYQNICHFGFTFVTTLTHEAGLVLETLDESLSNHLAQLALNGGLDNAVSVIMGDHGNRIGLVQLSYTGRIEERMPLLAIRLPTGFKEKYPREYRNFISNKYKLTSNFDLHQMLKDVALMRLGDVINSFKGDKSRGISLFDKIPAHRTCRDAYIPINFCTCMVDVSGEETLYTKYKIAPKSEEQRKKESLTAVFKWLREEKLDSCLRIESIKLVKDNFFTSLSLNMYARHGLRSFNNKTANEEVKNGSKYYDFVSHEMKVDGLTASGEDVQLLVRTEEDVVFNMTSLVFEPFVRIAPRRCRFNSISDVCTCLQK